MNSGDAVVSTFLEAKSGSTTTFAIPSDTRGKTNAISSGFARPGQAFALPGLRS
jgi:hypothetical protein